MNLVNVDKIFYDSEAKGYGVKLISYQGNESLVIIIGTDDAKEISLAKERVQLPRPSTHDLLVKIMESVNLRFKKIVIYDYKLGTFFSKIILEGVGLGEITVDARPSDSIILSLRSGCALYIDDIVFKKSSIREIKEMPIKPDNNDFKLSNESILNNLNKALSEAINMEKYEKAAELRDKINTLSKK